MLSKIAVAATLLNGAIAYGIPQKNESRTWEEMLPCRDGTELHTRIVMPRDDDGSKYTTIIDRSPYGYTDLEWIPGICFLFILTVLTYIIRLVSACWRLRYNWSGYARN